MKKIMSLLLLVLFCAMLIGCGSVFGKSDLDKEIEKNHQDLKNYPNPSVVMPKKDGENKEKSK